MASALEKGDVFITSLSPETADKIAGYFSKRNENFDRPVAEWISDAWISKEDFQASPEVLRAVDSNGDNRISRKEFAEALVTGSLKIGSARQTSHNPFTQPTPSNPFNPPAQNPFRPIPHPTQPSNPFKDPLVPVERDSGAYLKLEMARTLRSDFDKGQILAQLISETNLSTREQMMLIDTVKTLNSSHTRTELYKGLAKNPSLREEAMVHLAKATREINSDFSKNEILVQMINSQRLTPRAQQSVMISIGTISSEYTQVETFKRMLRHQHLDLPEKEFLMRQVGQNFHSDFNKRQIYELLMN